MRWLSVKVRAGRALEVKMYHDIVGLLDVPGRAGPADLVRRALEDTAALIFARALPSGAELGLGDCRSYAEWLSCTTCRS